MLNQIRWFEYKLFDLVQDKQNYWYNRNGQTIAWIKPL